MNKNSQNDPLSELQRLNIVRRTVREVHTLRALRNFLPVCIDYPLKDVYIMGELITINSDEELDEVLNAFADIGLSDRRLFRHSQLVLWRQWIMSNNDGENINYSKLMKKLHFSANSLRNIADLVAARADSFFSGTSRGRHGHVTHTHAMDN